MSTRPQPTAIPAGYNDTIPPLDAVTSPAAVNRLVASTGIIPFTDAADGYIMDLIETWCSNHSSTAAKELRFVIEQAKWMTGYRSLGKALLDQLPPR
jgi:hypothetical protein